MTAKFNHHPPYIPVLKWQRGEQRAIHELFPVAKERVWPCVDIRLEKQHKDFVTKFQNCWGRSALVDYANPEGLLKGWRRAAYGETLTAGLLQNCPFVPTLNPLDPQIGLDLALLALVKPFNRLAFRIRIDGMQIPSSALAACTNLIRALQPYAGHVQLVIDHRVTPESPGDPECQNMVNTLAQLKALGFWGVSFISGAYPDLLPKNNGTVLSPPRNDWALWQKLHGLNPVLALGFGDYGILSPTWTEVVLERRPNVSIRYTDSDRWLIIRGTAKTSAESITISKVLTQFHAAAFRKQAFSYGDRIIADRCDDMLPAKSKKCGNEMHVVEGWNHHISLVVQEQY